MLSLLIPTYNYNITSLVITLQEECSSNSIPFEIIVLDDCSKPGFIELNKNINTLPHCSFLVNESNLGRTMTRKKLAELATFDTLLFLDADVIPVSKDFIKNYIPYIKNETPVVFGGVSYKDEADNKNATLRLKYGKEREQQTAQQRTKNPYGLLFSANLLVSKTIFLENNYSEKNNFYGMDAFFGYMLYKKNIPVVHIENPVYHIGLEDNDIFFQKCLSSVKIKKQMFSEKEDVGETNSLLKHYRQLRRYHLAGAVGFFFKIGEPVLKKMILSKNPNLFCLDLYRLGYICSL